MADPEGIDLMAALTRSLEQARADRAARPSACQLGLLRICRGEEAEGCACASLEATEEPDQ